jgi:hypothetical protein
MKKSLWGIAYFMSVGIRKGGAAFLGAANYQDHNKRKQDKQFFHS